MRIRYSTTADARSTTVVEIESLRSILTVFSAAAPVDSVCNIRPGYRDVAIYYSLCKCKEERTAQHTPEHTLGVIQPAEA